eukprot:PITA_35207
MEEEMESLMHNQTWDVVSFPAGKTTLKNKWVYRSKGEDGEKERYKARLVVKGFAQKKGIDFDEIFSPVVKMTSIRTILSLVVVEDVHLQQLDIKTTFLCGIWRKRYICSNHKDMRYMNNLGKEHRMTVKWILRYLKGTANQALCFGGSNISLQGYVDADMAGDRDNRRSTTGYVFTVGGTTVSWVSKIQSVVALSTIEVEYVAATEASNEIIWLQRFMGEWVKEHDMGMLYSDSQSAIHLAKNSTFHSRTKHIQLKYHFI